MVGRLLADVWRVFLGFTTGTIGLFDDGNDWACIW
jgi:hypothetical protein